MFACGNVAHVHDLVDFVTAESERAGQAAAAYVQAGCADAGGPVVELKNGDGVGYTVPQHIRTANVNKVCGVFFRVNRVCGASAIIVRDGEHTVASFKRERLAPGEMERITLPRKLLEDAQGPLTIAVEEVPA